MSWKNVALGDVCKVIAGQSPESINYNKEGRGLAFYQGKKDFGDVYVNPPTVWTTEITKEAIRNDILMSVRAPVGPVNIATEHICIGRGLAAIRATERINQAYLFYYLLKIEKELVGNAGAVFNSINKTQIENLLVPLPSLSTQQKIVAKLDAIFAEIDTATAAAETNAGNAEALFQSYLNEVFASKENLTKLKDCTQIKPPKSEIKNLKGNTSVSFMPMESLGINDKFTISKQTKDLENVSGSYTYFTEGDVLLAKITPCFENGKLGIASNLVNGIGFGSSEYIVFRPNKNIDKEWLYYFLNRENFRVLGSQHMSGSVGHKRVTKEFIEETLIPLIPVAKQKEFVGKIDNVFVQSQILKSASNTKIRELTLLKQSILQRAFSGELVKD